MAQELVTEIEDQNIQTVRDAANGDRKAFDLLVSQYSERIFRLAIRMLGSREEAEDVRQETFITVYQKLKKLVDSKAFEAWIYRVAARICFSRMRKRSRGREVPLDPESVAVEGNPEQRLIALENAERAQKALNKMRPDQKLMIVLKYVEGLSHEELSLIIGCSAEASRTKLLRARKAYRKIYERM